MTSFSKAVVVELPFPENGAETIYTAVVKVVVLSFEMCFLKSCVHIKVGCEKHWWSVGLEIQWIP